MPNMLLVDSGSGLVSVKLLVVFPQLPVDSK